MDMPTDAELTWVYRVACALSGDASRARELVVRLVDREPAVGRVSEGRLIDALREGRGGFGGDLGLEGGAASFVAGVGRLGDDERDALMLVRGAGLEPARVDALLGGGLVARAAAAARASGVDVDGGGRALGVAFGGFVLGSGDGEVSRAIGRARGRRRAWTGVWAASLAAVMGLVGFVINDLLGWDEEQAALEVFSNPLPAELVDENVAPSNR